MKLHADKAERFTITAYGDDWVAINGERHTRSLVLSAVSGPRAWACDTFADLSAEHVNQLLEAGQEAPELVILGTGSRLRFAHPALLRSLTERRVGVETMDTPAACRTYNILAGEGRRVVLALLVGD